MEMSVAPVQLTEERLQAMLQAAAREGARQALERLGLHDEDAAGDLRTLRGVLDSVRAVKNGALKKLGEMLMLMLIGALMLWAAKAKFFNGGVP